MFKKKFYVQLDIKRSLSNREFEVVDGDNANELIITLTDNGAPVDLENCRVLAYSPSRTAKPPSRTRSTA